MLSQENINSLKPDALSPAEIEAKAEQLAIIKASMRFSRLFMLSVLAGAFIACGATLFTLVQGDTELPFAVKRIFGAACFSMGLMLVVCCGAELFTGNNLMICGLQSKKIGVKGLLYNWLVVWIGNFVGSLIIAALVFGSHMADMNSGAVGAAMVSIAAGKISPDALTLFCKAIMCNFLVCLAVWMSFAARTITDSIANMFFLFEGLFAQMAGYASAGIALSGIFYNLLIVTLGNIVGGALLVGLVYWFVYAKK